MRRVGIPVALIVVVFGGCRGALGIDDPITVECFVDTDCADPHMACISSGSCACVAGYTGDEACTWSGLVSDPDFDDASRWTLAYSDLVGGTWNPASCIDPGRATQDVTMPRRSRAEPLVAQMRYRGLDGTRVPAIGIGGVWSESRPKPDGELVTVRTCLGPGQFAPESSSGLGVPTKLELQPNDLDRNCVGFALDRVEILPADVGECPDSGLVLDGDFESDRGWTFFVFGNDAFAGIVPSGTDRGARLSAGRCSFAGALSQVAVPAADVMASPAVTYQSRAGRETDLLAVGFGNGGGFNVGITGPIEAAPVVCVPAPLRGGVYDLGLAVSNNEPNCIGEVISFEVDDVRVFDEPRCGNHVAISDPTFDSPFPLFGGMATAGKSEVSITDDPDGNGNRVLRLANLETCAATSYVARVVTPSPVGTNGPALVFRYRASTFERNQLFVTSELGRTVLPTGNPWTQHLTCLHPGLAGRDQRVTFSLEAANTSCGRPSADTAYLDDFEVTTDAACPSEVVSNLARTYASPDRVER